MDVWCNHLDDALVIGQTIEEHNDNLTIVLERLRAAGLTLKPIKCNFCSATSKLSRSCNLGRSTD